MDVHSPKYGNNRFDPIRKQMHVTVHAEPAILHKEEEGVFIFFSLPHPSLQVAIGIDSRWLIDSKRNANIPDFVKASLESKFDLQE